MTIHTASNNYETSVRIKSTRQEVIKALTTEIDQWWSDTEGSASVKGAIFKVSFGPESYWMFEVLNIVETDHIVWKCLASHQDHHLQGMDEEWLNSKLLWHISEANGLVQLDFLHEGLTSSGVCYDVCSSAWDFYIMSSLKNYLESGVGRAGEK